ncbi:MAG: c-type cytochrome [Acidobacteriales bacterium]|nr:c-type cytochrome [Terriglobales bacterium]
MPRGVVDILICTQGIAQRWARSKHGFHSNLSLLVLGAGAVNLGAQTPRRPQGPPGGGPPGGGMRAGPAAGYGTRDPAAIERGKKEYVAACAFCHGTSATGGQGGPDLIRSVLVLHDRGGDQIGPVILNGRPDKGMPKLTMTPAQISDISTFLHERMLEKSNRRTYKIQDVVTGDAKAGQAYFNGAGKCYTCHSPTGDLGGVAKKYDPVTLQSRFLYPRTRTFPGMPNPGPPSKPALVTVTEPSGKALSGALAHLDDFSVSLRDSAGEYHSWRRDLIPGLKVDVKDPLAVHVELLDQYTDRDMHNMLAYLETLK